jgi:ribulose kinase
MPVMVPGLWLHENGQSTTGALIDHLVQIHAAYPAVAEQVRQSGRVTSLPCWPTVWTRWRLVHRGPG